MATRITNAALIAAGRELLEYSKQNTSIAVQYAQYMRLSADL